MSPSPPRRAPTRPGPQPHNQIAATLRGQLARAGLSVAAVPFAEREARRLAATMLAYPELFAPVLAALRHDR